MQVIRIEKLNLDFHNAPLFKNASIIINKGERICLVGRNGTGKSTFLKILNNEISPDSVDRFNEDSIIISKLNQELPVIKNETAYNFVARGLKKSGSVLVEYHDHLNVDPSGHNDTWMNKLDWLQKEIDTNNAWDLETRIQTILTTLKIDQDVIVKDLSGGWRRRLELAQALVTNPDVLLLDEPTNHLDLDAISDLEKLILDFNGTIICVSHDRALVNNIATRIVELDRGGFYSYPGNFSAYLELKEKRLSDEAKTNSEFDKKLAREEIWIRQGIKARRTRNEGRVRDLVKLRDERSVRRDQISKPSFDIAKSELSGKLVAKAKNVSFQYPNSEREIIKDLSLTIMRGDRIGILGPNGCGKSTLLQLILGKLLPSSGTLKVGTNLQVAYFDQLRDQIDPNLTVADNVAGGRTQIVVNGKAKHIISYLSDFLFTPERTRSSVTKLSGGECNRLLLAKLFSLESNILVLDEPTNDLDIESLELLEDILQNYQGTVILVSHDRFFMDNVVTQLLAYEGHGVITEYVGSYTDWVNFKDKEALQIKSSVKQNKPKQKLERTQKKSSKNQKQAEHLLKNIDIAEKEITALNKMMATDDFHNKPKDETKKVYDKAREVELDLESLYSEWENLDN
ncbi:MAG: ATP-binding cassette domain-containing protein [Francisellaceae bacterium]|jgi:ABC transport system ATP-binding/permease protein|nr:ATP-binding cassette domain-containing protein [Francisellaceae bacterium]